MEPQLTEPLLRRVVSNKLKTVPTFVEVELSKYTPPSQKYDAVADVCPKNYATGKVEVNQVV